MQHIGMKTQPDILKMDIEGFEWDILEHLVDAGVHLPSSISLELHYKTQMTEIPWFGRFRSPFEIGLWADHLFTRGGYMLVDRNDNEYCPHCSEIVLAQLAHVKPPVS